MDRESTFLVAGYRLFFFFIPLQRAKYLLRKLLEVTVILSLNSE